MPLPRDLDLPVEHLAAGFRHTTNSYKFFWLLALLDHLRQGGEAVVPMPSLLAQMVARAWHPVHYHRLSFGVQDRLAALTRAVYERTGLPMQSRRDDVREATRDVLERGEASLADALRTLLRYVPYRFLRPWFADGLRGVADHRVGGVIERLAEEHFESARPPLYRFERIEEQVGLRLHPAWMSYLLRHLHLVEGFALWELVRYLQQQNPNVPGLPEKLRPAETRDLGRARRLWDAVLAAHPDLHCLYSGRPLSQSAYSLDHFVPWSFVAHDLLWNLAPTVPEVNAAKSDALPDLGHYGDAFARMQHTAVAAAYGQGQRKPLEDYALFFGAGLAEVAAMPLIDFRRRLLDGIAPLVQIAAHMGFRNGWRLRP